VTPKKRVGWTTLPSLERRFNGHGSPGHTARAAFLVHSTRGERADHSEWAASAMIGLAPAGQLARLLHVALPLRELGMVLAPVPLGPDGECPWRARASRAGHRAYRSKPAARAQAGLSLLRGHAGVACWLADTRTHRAPTVRLHSLRAGDAAILVSTCLVG